MDKKLLDALNNLSFAFEELAKTLAKASLDKDKSPTSTALSQTKIEKKLLLIDKGVKKIQADNQKILKGQQQLLKLAQQKQKKGPLDDVEKPVKKSKIKDGLQTIMLIAVGVLAIGLAFKIIGKVNILSVIALSIALPILAFSFDKIGKSKNLNPKKMKSIVLPSLLIMSLAIVGSSWILQFVKPVGIFKLFTATLIATAFVAISYSLPKLTRAFEKVSFMGVGKFLLLGPLVLMAMSTAIALSSRILGFVKPVGFFKLFTAIMISAAFTALSFGLPKLINGFKSISFIGVGKFILFGPKVLLAISVAIALSSRVLGFVKPVGLFKLFTAIMISVAFGAIGFGLGKILEGFRKSKMSQQEAVMVAGLIPIVFIALAIAITVTSRIFQKIKPVGLFKLITAALIGIVFIPLSYALPPLAKAMNRITKKQALLMPVVIVLLALAIMISSHIFKMTAILEFARLKNIVAQSLILVALTLAFTKMMPALRRISPSALLKGALVIIGLAVVVMITSHILSAGAYENYPSLQWILGVAATVGAFALGALTIGGMVFGPQALVVAAGIAAILVISAAITGTSHILNAGNYGTYPTLSWTLLALGSILAFATLALGVGVSGPLIVIGSLVIYGISYAIVQVASMLATGKYDVYPSLSWSLSSFGNIAAFAALATSLSIVGILVMLGIPFILQISQTIVDVSKTLAKGEYNVSGITEWTLSTVLLFSTFVPILGVLAVVALANSVAQFFGSDPFATANNMLIQISQTIVSVSHELAKGNYKEGPSRKWANGVALALGAFAPIYSMLVKNNIMKLLGGGGIGPEDFNKAIKTIIGGIKFAANEFAGSVFQTGGPSEKWAKGVGTALATFAPIFEILSKSKGLFGGPTPKQYRQAIRTIARGIIDAAEFFSKSSAKGSFSLKGVPSKKWGERVGAAISAFTPALEFITKNASIWSGADPKIIRKAIMSTALGITDSSLILKKGDFTTSIPKNWARDVGSSIKSFIEVLKKTPENFNSWDFYYFLRSMVRTSETFGQIAENLEGVKSNMMWKVFDNVIAYAELAKWLTTNDANPTTVYNAVDSMLQMAKGYSALGTAIKKLNSDLQDLDIEKLNALKSLNASVILISLMDPKNFKEMMEELEDKGGVLIEALNDLESKEGEEGGDGEGKKKGKGAPSPKLKTGDKKGDTAQKTMGDLYSIMESANQKLELIAKSSDKMSKYVDEIRGGDPLIRR